MITLNDGSTVSGRVTDLTRIGCEGPEPTQLETDDHGSGGGDQGNQGDRGDDHGDPGDQREDEMCSPASLTPGAVVQDAELSISSAGSVWDEVELASQR